MSGLTVVKVGGNALVEAGKVVRLIEELGHRNVVLVHGGGPQINELLERIGHRSSFRDGLRVTDSTTLDAVRMVLAGQVNTQFVGALRAQGLPAVGLSGVDGGTLVAEVKDEGALGFVGKMPKVDAKLLRTLLAGGFLPVLAPLSAGVQGGELNVNADTTAAAVAVGLGAERLIFLTDVCGVLDGQGRMLEALNAQEVDELHRRGVISIGMLPKLEAALFAGGAGVPQVEIKGVQKGPGTKVSAG